MFNVDNTAGVVTLANWTMMPDGSKHLHLWSPSWEILTDKQVPIENFHSSEKWQLLAVVKGKPLCVIPGCQVKAWVACDAPPPGKELYIFGG